MDEYVAALEERLRRAEEAIARLSERLGAGPPGGTTVSAPFRVQNERGEVLLEVSQSRQDVSLRLLNAQGQTKASLGLDGSDCGYLAIRNAAGVLVGYLSVEMAGARLLINDNQGEHGGGVVLSTDDTDGGGISVLHKTGSMTATLYSDTHGGVLEVYHAGTDKPVVTAAATPEGGQLTLSDKDGAPSTVLP